MPACRPASEERITTQRVDAPRSAAPARYKKTVQGGEFATIEKRPEALRGVRVGWPQALVASVWSTAAQIPRVRRECDTARMSVACLREQEKMTACRWSIQIVIATSISIATPLASA